MIYSTIKKQLLFSLLVLTSFQTTLSQKVITGRIFDESDRPLSNVTVFLNRSLKGTISNSDGAFQIRGLQNEDLLTFSHIGYENGLFSMDSINEPLIVHLKRKDIELHEVLITNTSARELLNKAITKIPENYAQEAFLTRMFYRAKIFTHPDSLIYVEETSFKQVKSYKSSFKDKTFLIRNRNFNFVKNSRIGIRGIGVFDAVKALAIRQTTAKENSFTFGHSTRFDGRPVYVIEINKDNEKEHLTKGKIFIDSEDLGLVRFEMHTDNKSNITQYKKINGKYFLVSTIINNRNKATNGGYHRVCTEMVMTEIQTNFNEDDVQGVPVDEKEAMQAYQTQGNDNAFWKTHNDILPDSVTRSKIMAYVLENPSFSMPNVPEKGASILKLYNPNIKLSISTDLLNDIHSQSENMVSLNLLTNHFFQKRIKNLYIGLLVPVFINDLILAPLEELETERKILAQNHLELKSNIFCFNSLNESYHYGLSVSEFNAFKSANPIGFMRLNLVRNEYHYLKAKTLEEEIVKADMGNKNNKYDYFLLYATEFLYSRLYNINFSVKDISLKEKDLNRSPMMVDRNKSWVKYLFEPEAGFQSWVKSADLTDPEKKYLKRSNLLSWINILSPQILGLDKIELSENALFTFSLDYLRTPFGDMTEQNLWLSYKRQLNGFFIRQYHNKQKTGFGVGYKLYDCLLSNVLSLNTTLDYWSQPDNLSFQETDYMHGIHIGQNLEYKLGKVKYLQRNKLSLFIGYDFKTKGYLPEIMETDRHFKVNCGFKVNF